MEQYTPTAIDPRTIDRSRLAQRSAVKLDFNAPQKERLASLLHQIDPHCYLDGKTVVISRFANTSVSLNDCVQAYLSGL